MERRERQTSHHIEDLNDLIDVFWLSQKNSQSLRLCRHNGIEHIVEGHNEILDCEFWSLQNSNRTQ